jgi:glycogen debranching enzyme
MPPGFTCILKVILSLEQMNAVKDLDELWNSDRAPLLKELMHNWTSEDLNFLLYSSENEEREKQKGQRGCYVLPNGQALVYAGFKSFSKIMRDCRFYNNLGHPLYENLRQGNWILDFLLSRFEKKSSMKHFLLWLARQFSYVKILPRHLIPKYFTRVTTVLLQVAHQKMAQAQRLDDNIYVIFATFS